MIGTVLKSFQLLLPLGLTLASMMAASPIQKRQSATTCGSNRYSSGQVSDAASAAYSYVSSGSEAGDSDYPHRVSLAKEPFRLSC